MDQYLAQVMTEQSDTSYELIRFYFYSRLFLIMLILFNPAHVSHVIDDWQIL